jgi:amino acid transporter
MFEAEMSGDCFQLLGMAERGLLPACFAKRSRYGTPIWGIVLNFFAVSVCALLSLQELLELLNVLYVWAFLLQAAAFVSLRVYQPELYRPYRVPVNNWGAFFMFIPSVCLIGGVFVFASWLTHVVSIACFFVGVGLYFVVEWCRSSRFCEFLDSDTYKKNMAITSSASLPEFTGTLNDSIVDSLLSNDKATGDSVGTSNAVNKVFIC